MYQKKLKKVSQL
jgi:hypothetical protein